MNLPTSLRTFKYPATMVRTSDSAPPLTYDSLATDRRARELVESVRTIESRHYIVTNSNWTIDDLTKQTPLVAVIAFLRAIWPHVV